MTYLERVVDNTSVSSALVLPFPRTRPHNIQRSLLQYQPEVVYTPKRRPISSTPVPPKLFYSPAYVTTELAGVRAEHTEALWHTCFARCDCAPHLLLRSGIHHVCPRRRQCFLSNTHLSQCEYTAGFASFGTASFGTAICTSRRSDGRYSDCRRRCAHFCCLPRALHRCRHRAYDHSKTQ